MIDTVILNIPIEQVDFSNIQVDGIESWNLQAKYKAYDKYVKNPSSKDIASGFYFPRLTKYNRKNNHLGWTTIIKVEFSVPKLIYKNNLDELEDGKFEEVIDILKNRLFRMGLSVRREILKNAAVSAVHYSKNIELTSGYTSQYVISELGKINLNKRFDFSRSRYLNDGQSLYAHTIAHSFIFYDKIADLFKNKKKAIDKEQPAYQLSLFEPLSSADHEILRFEVRLSQKRKLNAIFKKFGFNQNPTFQDVYSGNKSKQILLHYWDNIIAGNIALFAYTLNQKDILKEIVLVRKNIKPKTAIYLTGLLSLAKEGNGMREIRALIAKICNDRTWYRIVSDMKGISADLQKLKPREWCAQIKFQIENYQPLRLSKLQCKEL